MNEPDYIAELEQIRTAYVCSLPSQRLHIIAQRLENPAHGPNLLVTHVSAIEALARSLAMHAKGQSKAQLKKLYSQYRDREVQSIRSHWTKCLAQIWLRR